MIVARSRQAIEVINYWSLKAIDIEFEFCNDNVSGAVEEVIHNFQLNYLNTELKSKINWKKDQSYYKTSDASVLHIRVNTVKNANFMWLKNQLKMFNVPN